jgi:hypothetical protein
MARQLREQPQKLLAIPDVVGVYVGVLEDDRTPCLKAMLARKTPKSMRAISRNIEGYRVVVDVTGEIRALGKPLGGQGQSLVNP